MELLDSSSKNSKSWEEREPGESKDMKSDADDTLRWFVASDSMRTDPKVDLCSAPSCRDLHCLRSPVVSA